MQDQVMETVEVFFLNKSVRLLQPKTGFRTSFDSVMLASACPVKEGERVLDMGCGVGGASLCVLQRISDCHVSGIDMQSSYVELAQQNAKLNGHEDSADYFVGDIRDYDVERADHRYDHIICNPPYMERGAHLISPDKGKAIASGHLDDDMDVSVWVKAGLRLLKSGGSITFIHRADMMADILNAFGKSFGAAEIIPLWPKTGVSSKRVIIRAVKDRKSPLSLHAGLIVHNDDGSYTYKAEQILRDAAFIDDVLGL